jgi:pyrimidine operon attenuation protein / uracil phosphoribosyltransferase
MKEIMDENSINRSLIRMTHEILEKNKGVDDLVLVGIKTRGEALAKRIAVNIKNFEGVDIPCIGFDTRYWRDDIDRKNMVKPDFQLKIDGKIVVIVDDVLYKGRTVRAAMDGLMSFGRPKAIELAVLIDRGHRELPIRADIVGKNVPTASNEVVKVTLAEYDNTEKVLILEEGEIHG